MEKCGKDLGLEILLAENDIEWMSIIRKFLEMAQHNVTCCTDSFCTLHKLRTKSFNLLIINASLPDVDSIGIAEDIDIPIFFIETTEILDLKRRNFICLNNPRFHLFEGPINISILLKKAHAIFS